MNEYVHGRSRTVDLILITPALDPMALWGMAHIQGGGSTVVDDELESRVYWGLTGLDLEGQTDADYLGRQILHNYVNNAGYPPSRRIRPHGPSSASRISTIALLPSQVQLY